MSCCIFGRRILRRDGEADPSSEQGARMTTAAAFPSTRLGILLCVIVIAIIVAVVLYAGWIAIVNFSRIRV
jgi:hypothetical protein